MIGILLAVLALASAVSSSVITPAYPVTTEIPINDAAFVSNIPQYCNERCPKGFNYVAGHCYQLLWQLGPMTARNASLNCAQQTGGQLPNFDTEDQMLKVYKFYKLDLIGEKQNPFKKSKAKKIRNFIKDAGFWLGYARQCLEQEPDAKSAKKSANVAERKNGNNFKSFYNDAIAPDFIWRDDGKKQPQDESTWGEEACVARKQMLNYLTGADDYNCGAAHYALCQLRAVPFLQTRCTNPNQVTVPKYPGDPGYVDESLCTPTEYEFAYAALQKWGVEYAGLYTTPGAA